jgi:hypothetical protein
MNTLEIPCPLVSKLYILWNKTEFTCIKCGYCYSCHWKKEQIEEIELRNNLKDFYLSLSKDRNKNSQKLKSQKHEENGSTTRRKAEKWGTLDALGQLAEPIYTYYRCHHKFSLHGSIRCRYKHPTNKTLGIFVRSNCKKITLPMLIQHNMNRR